MVRFIDDHRDVYGVELICAAVPIAPSTYFLYKARDADPTRRSTRAQRDDALRVIIRRIWTEQFQVYGPRKVWRQMGREGLRVARCRVRRLMREMELAGAVRGRDLPWSAARRALALPLRRMTMAAAALAIPTVQN